MKNLEKICVLLLLAGCWQSAEAKKTKASEQHVYFNGVVTDAFKSPLKGVRVYTLSRSYSTRTNKEGKFGLTDVGEGDTLHLEYQKQHYAIPVQGRRGMRIVLGDQLVPQASEDQELADIGYGFVKRREKVISSSGIPGEVLARTGKTNLLDAMIGLVPGLYVVPNGRPGISPTVRIRGENSILADCTPLFVVDGVVTPSLDYLNIHDVESVEVLKDASIYGVRGANGAILVHTKTGKRK